MTPTLTNLGLVLLTLTAAAASAIALRRLRSAMAINQGAVNPDATTDPETRDDSLPATRPTPTEPGKTTLNLLVTAIALGAGALLVYRWAEVGEDWNPIAAHVDGLLLIASLLAAVGLFIQRRPRLGGLAVFILPLLTLILAWAICASTWTYKEFNPGSLYPVWTAVHLTGVYLGTLGCALAAVAGVMYLVVEQQLKAKRNPRGLLRLASLETLERLTVQTSAVGFALLTVGLVSGVLILREQGDALGEGWWYSPKIVLAFAAWALYAVVMNVRVATVFRGRRAAWLAVAGFVLLLVVYGIVTSGGHA